MLRVQDVMRTHTATVSEDTTLFEVMSFFLDTHISAAPVLDYAGKVVGVLSEKDILHALYPKYKVFYRNPQEFTAEHWNLIDGDEVRHMKVRDAMTRRSVTTTPDANVLGLGGLMLASGVHQIPVVENGLVVGMVGRHEIYRTIIHERYHMPLT